MFDIEYRGGNSVIISTKGLKLVTDPGLSAVGMKDVSVKGKVEVVTEERFLVNDPEARLIIDGPGEYEVGAFSIRGINPVSHVDIGPVGQATNMYRISVDDIRMALLGNITDPLSEDQLESIGVIDIVIMPIGGEGYTLSHEVAARIIRQLDPKVVIPISSADSLVGDEGAKKDLTAFMGELSVPLEETDKYRVKSASVLPATMTVVSLRRS